MNAALEPEFAEALLRRIAGLCDRLDGPRARRGRRRPRHRQDRRRPRDPAEPADVAGDVPLDAQADPRRAHRVDPAADATPRSSSTPTATSSRCSTTSSRSAWTSSTPSRRRPARWPISRGSSGATATRSMFCGGDRHPADPPARHARRGRGRRSGGSSASSGRAAATCSSSVHTIMNDVPAANILAMVDAVEAYGTYPLAGR